MDNVGTTAIDVHIRSMSTLDPLDAAARSLGFESCDALFDAVAESSEPEIEIEAAGAIRLVSRSLLIDVFEALDRQVSR